MFCLIQGKIINLDFVECMEYYSNGGRLHILFNSGNNITFDGINDSYRDIIEELKYYQDEKMMII